MSGFLLDTNVLSEFARPYNPPDQRVKQWLEAADPDLLYASVLTFGEIKRGIEKLQRASVVVIWKPGWQKTCTNGLKLAFWSLTKQLPTVEEYLQPQPKERALLSPSSTDSYPPPQLSTSLRLLPGIVRTSLMRVCRFLTLGGLKVDRIYSFTSEFWSKTILWRRRALGHVYWRDTLVPLITI